VKRKYLILFSLSGLILTCDQLTKHLVHSHFTAETNISVLPPFVSLILTRNTGFAFGLLKTAPASLRDIFFIAVPVFALILIVLIFIKLQDNQMLTSVALASILGGAIGNLIDRLQYGYVIDFIDFHWRELFHLPPFNVADCSIILGVGIMFINTLFLRKESEIPST